MLHKVQQQRFEIASEESLAKRLGCRANAIGLRDRGAIKMPVAVDSNGDRPFAHQSRQQRANGSVVPITTDCKTVAIKSPAACSSLSHTASMTAHSASVICKFVSAIFTSRLPFTTVVVTWRGQVTTDVVSRQAFPQHPACWPPRNAAGGIDVSKKIFENREGSGLLLHPRRVRVSAFECPAECPASNPCFQADRDQPEASVHELHRNPRAALAVLRR